jgi:translocator protein
LLDDEQSGVRGLQLKDSMNVPSLIHHPVIQGTAFFLGINALARIGGGHAREIYACLDKPSWAPPPWVFDPAWMISDVARIRGDLSVLHSPPSRARTAVLALEAVNWLAYAAYNPLLFGKRSTKVSFGVAVIQAAATAAAAIAGRRFGRRFLLGLAPTAAWLMYSVPLAGYVALHNRDHLIGR